MTFDEYQREAATTAHYPGRLESNPIYPVLGLNGEAGEVAEKLKKLIRDEEWEKGPLPENVRAAMAKELGDVLWYISACCDELEITMAEVAQINIDKLRSRQKRDKIKGSGDDR